MTGDVVSYTKEELGLYHCPQLINYGCHVKVGPGTLLRTYQTKKSVPDRLSALKKVSAGRMTLAANP